MVGLGEASHGDAESTLLRSAVILEVMRRRGHVQLGFERNDDPSGQAVHSYITTGIPDLTTVMSGNLMYPWETEEMRALLAELREANRSGEARVEAFGFDVQSNRSGSPTGHRREMLMAEAVRDRVVNTQAPITLLWAHNLHVCKGQKMMGGQILKRLQSYSSVGFFFSSGSYNRMRDLVPVVATQAPPGSVEAVLDSMNPGGIVVAPSVAHEAFSQPMLSRHTGNPDDARQFQQYPPMRELFDVLVHFPVASPAVASPTARP